MFITFEGIDCAGKSTQTAMLASYLTKQNKKIFTTSEPGNGTISFMIRKLIADKNCNLLPGTQMLLFIANRLEHVIKEIIPALNANNIVLCDRFIDSTIAYQGYGLNQNIEIIQYLHKNMLTNLMPDITFFLDIKPQESIERLKNKNKQDYYESLNINFYEKVYNGFQKIISENPNRMVLINGSKTINEVHKQIIEACAKIL